LKYWCILSGFLYAVSLNICLKAKGEFKNAEHVTVEHRYNPVSKKVVRTKGVTSNQRWGHKRGQIGINRALIKR